MRSVTVLILCLGLMNMWCAAQETPAAPEKDAAEQPASPAPEKKAMPRNSGPKLCVASIANSTLKGVRVHEAHEQLADGLSQRGLNAEASPTLSIVAKKLEPSANNREVIRQRKCEYLLLSEAARALPPDPAGNDKYRLDFALYKKGQLEKAVIEDSIPLTVTSSVDAAVVSALDKEVEAVTAAMPKAKKREKK